MSEPLADGREVDAGLEQVDRSRVAQRVRVDAPSAKGRQGRGALRQALLEQVMDAEAQRCRASISNQKPQGKR